MREQDKNRRHLRRRILYELVHDLEELFDLSRPGLRKLVLDIDEENDAEGLAASNCGHNGRRVGGVYCDIVALRIPSMAKPRRINVDDFKLLVGVR